jgi:carbamoyl-phosphate synthase small subunit
LQKNAVTLKVLNGLKVLGLGQGFTQPELKYHVVAYDYGVKTNILRMLADRGCKLTVVPAQTPAEKVSH